MSTKFKTWIVEFQVAATWTDDGFDLTNEAAKDMIEERLPYARPDETKALVVSSPGIVLCSRICMAIDASREAAEIVKLIVADHEMSEETAHRQRVAIKKWAEEYAKGDYVGYRLLDDGGTRFNGYDWTIDIQIGSAPEPAKIGE